MHLLFKKAGIRSKNFDHTRELGFSRNKRLQLGIALAV
jgi:hypothetical protein